MKQSAIKMRISRTIQVIDKYNKRKDYDKVLKYTNDLKLLIESLIKEEQHENQ